MMAKRNIRLSDIDREILMILYRLNWAYDYHIAAMVGENHLYIKGRLKQLAQAGLIGRKILIGNQPAACWILKDGMIALEVEPRKVHEPRPKTCEHDRACADVYTSIVIATVIRDGRRFRPYSLERIITERDLFVARKTIATGHYKKDGTMIYKPVDTAHRPDGYVVWGNHRYVALEAELTPKSTKSKLFDNMDSNFTYFAMQWWFTDRESIKQAIQAHAEELGFSDKVKVFSLTMYISR